MDSAAGVDSLIQHAYLAGAHQSTWHVFVESLRQSLGAASTFLAFVDNGGRRLNGVGRALPRPQSSDSSPVATQFATSSASTVFCGEDSRPWIVKASVDVSARRAVAPRKRSSGELAFAIAIDASSAARLVAEPMPEHCFGDAEYQVCRRLLPHIRTALQMSRRLADKTRAQRAALAALRGSATAVFVCDASATVIFQNAAALGVGALAVRDGSLCVSRGSSGSLHRAIAAVAGRRDASAEESILVPGPSAGPVVVRIEAVTADDILPFARPVVAISVVKPSPVPSFAAVLIRGMYGFTPAEYALAVRLMEGKAVAEAAMTLGITRETARTRLKRLFDKTGTRRQADLVRTLLSATVVM